MRRYVVGLWVVLALPALPAAAQVATDVPSGHWAYEAVQDLAARGLIKGYPPRGDVFGKRTATRYEIASVLYRVLQQVDEIYTKKVEQEKAPDATAQPGVKPEQLAEVKRLVEEFQKELLVVGGDLSKAQTQIAALEAQVGAVRRTAEQAASDAAAARQEAARLRKDQDALKGTVAANSKEVERIGREQRAHKVSGYFQGRFDLLDGGSALFPPGGAGGTGQTPTLGAPAVGGSPYGFYLRRVRLKVSGPIAARSDYTVQLDAQSVGSVSLMDAYVNLADLPAKGLTGKFGQFSPPFGYELPFSSASRESPERAFGFGTSATDYSIFKTTVSATGGTVTPGSVVPLFLNQNRDVGATVAWASKGPAATQTRVTFGAINGEGRSGSGVRNQNRGADLIGRVETGLLRGNLGLGLSGYYGSLSVRSGAPTGTPATPVAFTNAYRYLGGADIRYRAPWGTTFRAEWLGGLFETTPDRAQYLQGNHVYAWYFTARHPLSRRLELVGKYDEFYPLSQSGKAAGGLGRMDLVRKTLAGGLLYQLDDATRFRLWYQKGLTPYDPSAASGPLRSRLGLLSGEVQVSF